ANNKSRIRIDAKLTQSSQYALRLRLRMHHVVTPHREIDQRSEPDDIQLELARSPRLERYDSNSRAALVERVKHHLNAGVGRQMLMVRRVVVLFKTREHLFDHRLTVASEDFVRSHVPEVGELINVGRGAGVSLNRMKKSYSVSRFRVCQRA